MRLRLRFVLIFTLIVSLILTICLLITLWSYSSLDKSRFDQRLVAFGQTAFNNYYKVQDIKDIVYPESINRYQFLLLDSNKNILFTNASASNFPISKELLSKTKKEKFVSFWKDSLQGVSVYVNDKGLKGFVLAIGNNISGKERIQSLQLIIGIVIIFGFLFTGTFALYYVLWITRPLVNLSSQMRHITENNLNQKIIIQKGKSKQNEIYQIASNFNDMLDRLAKAFHLQKNFVHHASHELRTSLATMLAQTESALRKNLSPEEAVNVLKSLKEDQQEMIDLTNSLLLLSQYENIQYSKNWPKIRMDEIIFDTIGATKKLLLDSKIIFDFKLNPKDDLYLTLPGNETLLRSAIRNLIKNAYQYSTNKEVYVSLEANENEINIIIENDGQIISPENEEKLFIPFFRGENAMNKKGSGLGLPIVKRIAELHKATLSYESIGDNLNRFKFTYSRIDSATTVIH